MAKAERNNQKTNALRVIEASGVPFEWMTFETEEAVSGIEVAHILGLDADQVFKTLVTQAKSGAYYVFMVPVALELDLKKAAAAANEKAIAMIHSRDLLPLTGYVHGGCSPIGMKKLFPTFIDETAELFGEIYFSGGRIGCQVKMNPSDLARIIPLSFADIATSA